MTRQELRESLNSQRRYGIQIEGMSRLVGRPRLPVARWEVRLQPRLRLRVVRREEKQQVSGRIQTILVRTQRRLCQIRRDVFQPGDGVGPVDPPGFDTQRAVIPPVGVSEDKGARLCMVGNRRDA